MESAGVWILAACLVMRLAAGFGALKGSDPPHPQTRRDDLAGAVPQEIRKQTSVGFGVSETAADCRAKVLLSSSTCSLWL